MWKPRCIVMIKSLQWAHMVIGSWVWLMTETVHILNDTFSAQMLGCGEMWFSKTRMAIESGLFVARLALWLYGWQFICWSVAHFGPDWNVSTSTRWTAMKFCLDVHVPQRMNPTDFGVPICPLLWLMTKYLQD